MRRALAKVSPIVERTERLHRSWARITLDETFTAIVHQAADTGDSRSLNSNQMPGWAKELRKMLNDFEESEFSSIKGSVLQTLCDTGARYGFVTLECSAPATVWRLLSGKAKRHLQDNLRRILARATRPAFTLQLDAFRCAMAALCHGSMSDAKAMMRRKFLAGRAIDRLLALFTNFPVLAKLWPVLISQWRSQAIEVLNRLDADREAMSDTFFDSVPIQKIIDIRPGLSDPHDGGRTVVSIRCNNGSVIYKPRSGDGEHSWFKFIKLQNARGLKPRLKVAHILGRPTYCWMEYIDYTSCRNNAEAKRFYLRLGSVIAFAYLLRAVDYHRDNLIASADHPVIIDAETLWHVEPKSTGRSPTDRLYHTGFFPLPHQRGRDCSVLGSSAIGKYTPRLRLKPITARRYAREIIAGFKRGWRSALGSRQARAEFMQFLNDLRSVKRRWIYRPTMFYEQIIRGSLQPMALRSGTTRDYLIANLCKHTAIPLTIMKREIASLKRLDIPYFTHKHRSVPNSLNGVGSASAAVEVIREVCGKSIR